MLLPDSSSSRPDRNVFESHVRFGDPETEALMFLSQWVTFAEIIRVRIERQLDSANVVIEPVRSHHGLDKSGSPGKAEQRIEITVKEVLEIVGFHAGTKANDGKIVTDGGRVLGVCAKGDTPEDALALAYQE